MLPGLPRVITREQARRIDQLAVQRYGLPTIVLMENAARALTDAALREATRTGRTRVLIAAGTGNNGGDGLAAARLLANAGIEVQIVLLDEPTTPDAILHRGVAERMRLPIRPWQAERTIGDESRAQIAWEAGTAILLDCVLGTGLSRPIEGAAAEMIRWINARRAGGDIVVAADVPSGLDADTGRPLGQAVRADVTVTFVAPKIGFGARAAGEYLGRVVVADIGVPVGAIRLACDEAGSA